jgi:MinD-like ATPase involved in chromosome partitioning or flagellar assembly
MRRGTVITFYSYKGGVGRTFALANVAALLSVWGYKVLCVDWDLEAPGLHLYFQKWMSQESVVGLTELIQTFKDGEEPRWQNFVTPISLPKGKEPLQLMAAGRQDESYIQRMQSLNWEALYENQQLGNYLETLRKEWKEEFDFILIDSRTGITDIGGICTVQMPDLICLFFTANKQSLSGAVDVVKRASNLRNKLPFDRDKLWVLPVVTRFESRVEYEVAQEWLDIFTKVLTPLYEEWSHKDVATADLLNFTKIPYVPYWSFGEKVPALEENTKDPDSISFAFETITAMLCLKLSSTDVLIRKRDSYIETAQQGSARFNLLSDKSISQPEQPKKPVRVFLSYSHKDEVLRDELIKYLSVFKRQGLIAAWHDRQISAGTEWQSEISAKLEEADIILLLVNADFLASDYAYDIEIQRALERHESGEARVIPIILRPCAWQDSPFSKLQALPKNAKPITIWENQDAAFIDVIQGIRQVINSLQVTKIEETLLSKEIFISYAWEGESEEVANQLETAFQARGITIIRDKQDLGKGLIKEFMQRMGRGKCVIMLINEKYLLSKNCMSELVEIANNSWFYDRIFPVVLENAKIYDPLDRIKYIQYWEFKAKELNEAIKSLDSPANLQALREELNLYTEIRKTIAELIDTLQNMNTITVQISTESSFSELVNAVEQKLSE